MDQNKKQIMESNLIIKKISASLKISNLIKAFSRLKKTKLIIWAEVLNCLIFLSVLSLFTNSAQASSTKNFLRINSIYFNGGDSLIFETESKNKNDIFDFEKINTHSIVLQTTKISDDFIDSLVENKFLENEQFQVEIKRIKSKERSWYQSKDALLLSFRDKKENEGGEFSFNKRVMVPGLAYELSFFDSSLNWIAASPTAPRNDGLAMAARNDGLAMAARNDGVNDDSHQLQASFPKTRTEEFIAKLDTELVSSILENKDFQDKNSMQADSAKLINLANKLKENGEKESALKAYREAISIDPNNLNAKLALARASEDDSEKLFNYLETVNEDALLNIAESWFKEGLDSQSIKKLSQSLISYQLLILKDPENAQYRFNYAQALEQSGGDYFNQSPKRYLESAVLAKKQVLAGNIKQEPLLREATESLIRVLTLQGKAENAVKYCDSYIKLGYRKFLNGKSIAAMKKEISFNKNPFLRT